MRVSLRLLVLAILLCVGSFSGLLSPSSKADPCGDGCANGYEACVKTCNSGPHPPSCASDCAVGLSNCLDQCGGINQGPPRPKQPYIN